MKRLWILGAADPEMELIEELLRNRGEMLVYASVAGRRVHPGNAYKADPVGIPAGCRPILVECGGDWDRGLDRVDHHRPGDPGYGRDPEEFWPASSLGQIWAILGGGEPPREHLLAAAADHCLAAAYQGRCPGIAPDELMVWRVQTRARFQKRDPNEILASVEQARRALRAAPSVELAPGIAVRDLRGELIPELPEAAAREGLAFLSEVRDPDGAIKVVCQAGTPDQIQAFLDWARHQGLTGIYGDPARGFAGAYLP